MKFQLPIVPSRPQQWFKKITTRLANNFIKLTLGSLQTWSRRQCNSFSAQIFFQTTTYPHAMSGNFHPPAPLHSSCHYLTPATFRCHLPMENVKALLHGTSLHTSQQILLEGKIRPANWSYHKNPQRCDLPTFGAFFLGREVSNSDKTIPPWAEKELLDAISKKGKGQQDIVIGAMYRGSSDHTAYKAGGNEKVQLGVIEKGIVTTSEKYTIAQPTRGLEIHRSQMG